VKFTCFPPPLPCAAPCAPAGSTVEGLWGDVVEMKRQLLRVAKVAEALRKRVSEAELAAQSAKLSCSRWGGGEGVPGNENRLQATHTHTHTHTHTLFLILPWSTSSTPLHTHLSSPSLSPCLLLSHARYRARVRESQEKLAAVNTQYSSYKSASLKHHDACMVLVHDLTVGGWSAAGEGGMGRCCAMATRGS
jgi:hypothetical protein